MITAAGSPGWLPEFALSLGEVMLAAADLATDQHELLTSLFAGSA